MTVYKNASAFIDILNAHGVDKVFLNAGGELASIQSYVAKARVEGRQAPQLVLCLDESVAASAAYGNYMVSGKPQVVMAHAELGLLQMGGNLQSLQWGRIPALILTGYDPNDVKRTLWNGQQHNQGNIVRHVVKYDYCLKGDEDLHEVLGEAFRIACTEPTGPVYITFPMPYFGKEVEKPAATPAPVKPERLPAADRATLENIADTLLAAQHPLLISGFAGRYHENVGALVTLAETLGATAITGYSWMNFPNDHPLCAGIEQIGGSRKAQLDHDEADVVLVVDYDVPYVGGPPRYGSDVKILQIDVDPLTQGRLLWGRGADVFLKADAREAVPALIQILKGKITPEKRAALDKRAAQIAAHNEEMRRVWYDTAKNLSAQDPISPDYLCHCLNQLIDEETIVVNHTLAQCASVTEQVVRTKPGTWFGCPSGGIGWAPGAALGAASAAPGKTVVAVMTDGGFVWGCPTSTLWTAANYRFPFLAIVCNNEGYGAIRDIEKSVLGDNNLSDPFFAEAAVDFQPDYALIAQGAGAFGRKVTKSDEVLPALREALAAVRGGKPAVLDVYLPKHI